MGKSTLGIAKAYYTAMAGKNSDEMSKYLHPEARFNSPLGVLEGRDNILDAAKRFMARFDMLTIRAMCGSEDQAMLAIDFNFPSPIGDISAAVLLSFREERIVEIETFLDPRLLEPTKDELFRDK